jgi:hypothetical protein
MHKIFTFNILLISIIAFLSGCKKEEGTGGDCNIKGKVLLKVYDPEYKVLQKNVPAADENIYIIYGNDDFVSDKVTTSYDGSFEFEYLMPGNYKILAYTEDSSGNLGKKASVIREIKVEKSKTITVDTMYIIKSIGYNDGYATISGKVRQINWAKDYFYRIDTTFAQEREVYLTYGNHVVFDQRYRTGYNGVFTLQNLIVGDYTIYVYSEDIYGAPNDHAIIYQFSVNALNQFFDKNGVQITSIPDIFINKEI